MFETIVFGGGGMRCLWQGGFLEDADRQSLSPKHIVAVSAGALYAVSYVIGNGITVRQEMKETFKSIDQNLRWTACMNEKAIAPHIEAYREAVHCAFTEQDVQKLREGPDLSILISRPPKFFSPKVAAALGICAYQLDLVIRGTPHSVFAGKLGFRPAWVKANEVQTPSELCDLLIAAGCIPPIIPLQNWENDPALDGGLIDNAPIDAWESRHGHAGQSLILVTRQYRTLPTKANRVYMQPSKPIPASKLDFTDPDQIIDAYELGKKDGERFWTRIRDGASPMEASQAFQN